MASKPEGKLGPNGTAYLDLTRAAAANAVLYGHYCAVFGAGEAHGAGPFGVSIFFLLSGFLILHSSLARVGRPGPWFVPYMIDRWARIFTAYIPALIAVAVLNHVIDFGVWGQAGHATGLWAFFGNLFLLQNYPLFQLLLRAVGPGLFYIRPYNTAEPFWTIPIEFWIYVAFGVLFFGLLLRERLRSVFVGILFLVALPVVIWNMMAGGGNGLTITWMIGAVAAYLWTTAWRRAPRAAQIALVFGAISLAALIGRGLKLHWNFQDLGMVACEAILMLSGLVLAEALPVLPRGVRSACTFLASYSYSLYLTHNTVLILCGLELPEGLGWAKAAMAVAACHGVAFGLYWFAERHHREVGAWIKRRLFKSAGPSQTNPAAAALDTSLRPAA